MADFVNVIDMQGGNPLWPDPVASPLCAYSMNQLKPELDIDVSTSMVYVCWEDQRDIGLDPSDIYVQGFSVPYPTSLRWTTDGIPATAAQQGQTIPRISGKVIVWQDGRRDPIYNDTNDDENIYCELLGEECDGPTDMHWKNMYVKHQQGGSFLDHHFVVDTAGSRYIVWSETNTDQGDEGGIYVQKLDHRGVPRWQNNGVRVNDPGTTGVIPDICVDDQGGAFVCWLQNGSEIMLARVDANGTITGAISVMSGNVGSPCVVEDDAMNVYISYLGGGINVAKYSSILTQTQGTFTTGTIYAHYNKMVKDRQGGVWCTFRDAMDVYVFAYGGSTAAINIPRGITTFLGLPLNPVYEYDIVTDVLPSDQAGNVKNMVAAPMDRLFDLLITFTSRKTFANFPVDVYAIRCSEQNGNVLPEAPVQLTNVTVTFDRVYHPSIAVDSIPNSYNPGSGTPEIGGAIIAWAHEAADPVSGIRYSDVNTNRVVWNGSIGALSGATFWPTFLTLDQGISFVPNLDIAANFRSTPIGSTGEGLVVWAADQMSACGPSPIALGGQFIDYTRVNSDPRQWGPNGKAVSPLAQTTQQTIPQLQTLCPRPQDTFIPVLWKDDRSGTPCLVATSVVDEVENYLHTIGWQKTVSREEPSAQPDIIRIGDISPQPFSRSTNSSMSIGIFGDGRWLEMNLLDISGRLISRVYEGSPNESGAMISWRPLALLAPGTYLFELTGAETHMVRQIVIIP